MAIESKFQSLSLGGAISYVECADLQNNIPAILEVIKFIYDNIMYAELNTKAIIVKYADMTEKSKSLITIISWFGSVLIVAIEIQIKWMLLGVLVDWLNNIVHVK